jgi:hypothetical protein
MVNKLKLTVTTIRRSALETHSSRNLCPACGGAETEVTIDGKVTPSAIIETSDFAELTTAIADCLSTNLTLPGDLQGADYEI